MSKKNSVFKMRPVRFEKSGLKLFSLLSMKKKLCLICKHKVAVINGYRLMLPYEKTCHLSLTWWTLKIKTFKRNYFTAVHVQKDELRIAAVAVRTRFQTIPLPCRFGFTGRGRPFRFPTHVLCSWKIRRSGFSLSSTRLLRAISLWIQIGPYITASASSECETPQRKSYTGFHSC